MIKVFILSITLLSLIGCAQEAAYVDHEFGKAQNDAFDQQIAYKNPEHAKVTPTGMAGIHSEKIMDTYQGSFDGEINFTRGVNQLTEE